MYDAAVPTTDNAVVNQNQTPLRLRECREQGNLTLATAARRIGVSVTHLSRIERGQRQPSIGVLLQLARLYQVGVGELVGEQAPTTRKVVRADEAEQREGHDGTYMTLSGLAGFSGMEVIRLEALRRGGSQHGSSHDDEEWMYVVEGSVEVELGDESITLSVGDSVHFDARTSHRIASSNDSATKLLIVSAPLGSSRRNGHV